MTKLLDELRQRDPRFEVIVIASGGQLQTWADLADTSGALAAAYGASCNTFYLLRPDLHVAGRWGAAVGKEIVGSMSACLGGKQR